jgi:putative DNA primase/helicase
MYEPTGPGLVEWPEPEQVPTQLPPVQPFDPRRFVPPVLAPWVEDIAERAQCPPDFVGVAAMVEAAAPVGRQITIRPKRADEWTVVPNLWGLVVGRPGIMKSPALHDALKPLRRLIAEAQAEFRIKSAELDFMAAKQKALQDKLKRELGKRLEANDATDDLRAAFLESPAYTAPTERRYLVNDTTVEKLGELLNQNPNGLLLFRDELLGFLGTMDRQGHENDRAFYCEAWDGNASYTYDRIARGTLHIERCCLSVLGGIQPGPLRGYLAEVFSGGRDDGLVQRFQLLVYPDMPGEWRNVDRCPEARGLEAATDIYKRLAQLTPEIVGATSVTVGDPPYLRFAPGAQEAFDAWRAKLERTLRADDEHPVITSHLSKYRSLMPSLALLLHVVECLGRGRRGPVTLEAAEQAIAWCAYLETHARRVYHPVTARLRTTTALLAGKIKTGRLTTPFTAREIHRAEWSGLTDLEGIQGALEYLGELHWVRAEDVPPSPTGGRRTVRYHINPNIVRESPTKPTQPGPQRVSAVLSVGGLGISPRIPSDGSLTDASDEAAL